MARYNYKTKYKRLSNEQLVLRLNKYSEYLDKHLGFIDCTDYVRNISYIESLLK